MNKDDILKTVQRPMTSENVVSKLRFFTRMLIANSGELELKFLEMVRALLNFAFNVIQTEYSTAPHLQEIVISYAACSVLVDMELDALNGFSF